MTNQRWMSRPTSLLLDKSVVRTILRGIQRRRLGLTLPEEQQTSLRLYQAAKLTLGCAYITKETYNLVSDRRNIAITAGLLSDLRELKPGKYLKFNTHYESINIRLHRMTTQLGLPYKNAALPWVALPDDILFAMLT